MKLAREKGSNDTGGRPLIYFPSMQGTNSFWPEIDPRDVLRELDYPEAVEIKAIAGGWDTAMWWLSTADGVQHALRLYRDDSRAAAVAREQAALAAAVSGGIPAPAVETSGSWQGRPAMILSWRPGVPLTTDLGRRPWHVWRLGREFGKLQARIHGVPAPDALRAGAPSYWLLRGGGGADIDLSYLDSAHMVTDTFAHMDFHPLNVLTDGKSITGLVDWTNAATADPRADLAWTMTLLRVGPMPPHPLNVLLSRARLLLYLGWRRGYESEAGRIPDLSPFLVWAGNVLLNEIEPRLQDAQVWATAKQFEPLRRWMKKWQRRVA